MLFFLGRSVVRGLRSNGKPNSLYGPVNARPAKTPVELGGSMLWPVVGGLMLLPAFYVFAHSIAWGLFFVLFFGCLAVAYGSMLKPDRVRHARTRQIKRGQRVVGLLKPTCPVCQAGPGGSCKPLPGIELAMVDPVWQTLCHFERMNAAIRQGTARRRDVIAQWGPNLPKGLIDA
jgi:hypothetical protein